MQCVIPGTNIKAFGRAVHALAKIGDELYVDPDTDALSLRTVNASRSAYAAITLRRLFFSQYQQGRAGTEAQEPVKCKVALKSCLSAFRSLAALEKTVERCRISLEEDNARMVVHMECKHKINKTYHIAFIECETLQAVYSPSEAQNRLSATPRVLLEAAAHFQTSQEEVTLSVSPRQLGIRNYTDDEPDPAKAIRTALKLSPAEFDTYTVSADVEVTFCLRELRAVLLFCEPLLAPLTLSFDGPGRPIVFCASVPDTVEAHFVLATLADRSDTQRAAAETAADVTADISAGRLSKGDGAAVQSKQNGTLNGSLRDHHRSSRGPASPGPRPAPTPAAPPCPPACTSTPLEAPASPPGLPQRGDGSGDAPAPAPDSEQFPPLQPQPADPATPPAKRARFTFQRCFNRTMDPLRLPGHQRVLAPDSDED